MPAIWPSDLPYYVRPRAWNLDSPFRAPHRTNFEDGNKRARRSTSKNIATITFTLIPFTGEEFEIFKEWVRDDLVDGTLAAGFAMRVFTGIEYSERTCHFVNDPPYETSADGLYIQISMTLDVENL